MLKRKIDPPGFYGYGGRVCNAYKIGKQGGVSAREIDEVVQATSANLPENQRRPDGYLIRRTSPGLVVRDVDGKLVASVMRWGFFHPIHREVNNTRSESLKSPFWQESLAERRCLVPISEYYEWQELPAGAPKGLKKPCFSFSRPDQSYLWVAGVWQTFEGLGECYSTITTRPSAVVEAIHDRQLAVLDWEMAMSFLAGDKMPWEPYEGALRIKEVPSPLLRAKGEKEPAKAKPLPPAQGELF